MESCNREKQFYTKVNDINGMKDKTSDLFI